MSYMKDLPLLEGLSLENTIITDEGVKELSSVKRLRKLLLRDTKVSMSEIMKLKKHLPRLEIAQ